MPALTVVVPCYNASKTLPATLDSILAQDWKDFEVICVDDGSTDSTADLVRERARYDSRVRVVVQKNQGAFAARMNGIRQADSEFITFVDSDDLLYGNHFSTMMSSVTEDVDIVVSGYRYVRSNGEIIFEVVPAEGKISAVEALRVLLGSWRGGMYPVWNKVYRKSCLVDVDMTGHPNLLAEDQFFNGRVLLGSLCGQISFVKNIGYIYAQSDGSLITGFNFTQVRDFFVWLCEREIWLGIVGKSRGNCLACRQVNFDEFLNFYGKIHRAHNFQGLRYFESQLWRHRHLIGWSAALRSPYRLARLVKFAFRLVRSRLAGRKALA